MEEGSEKYKRPKITLEALKVNIQNGKYVSSLSKQPHLHMNEDMYTTPGILLFIFWFWHLDKNKKSSLFGWPIKHCNQWSKSEWWITVLLQTLVITEKGWGGRGTRKGLWGGSSVKKKS